MVMEWDTINGVLNCLGHTGDKVIKHVRLRMKLVVRWLVCGGCLGLSWSLRSSWGSCNRWSGRWSASCSSWHTPVLGCGKEAAG